MGYSMPRARPWEARTPIPVHALSAALKDNDARVRRDAAWALGDIGPAAHDAVPALVAALKDNVAEVRRAAAAALEKLDPAAARSRRDSPSKPPRARKNQPTSPSREKA